ncbi:hypothetical protein [Flavobacterium sp. PS2]|uniref:hypothetical protein n=1 Tax=Flavobacterium sp. PS2 TaxID=3384157 RepID=UPI00390CDA55
MKIKDIILFPFQLLLLILKAISRFILKNERNKESKKNEEKFSGLYKELNTLKKEKENLSTENNSLTARLSRFKEILEDSPNNTFELTTTKKKELVIISYSNQNLFDTIRLFGENGNDKYGDCKIEFTKRGEEIHIEGFQSKIEGKGKGYGRVLMNFTIKKALEKNFKSITGKLSDVDSKSFNWLIPFYESFGFKCTLYEPDEKIIVGKIELNLRKDTIL